MGMLLTVIPQRRSRMRDVIGLLRRSPTMPSVAVPRSVPVAVYTTTPAGAPPPNAAGAAAPHDTVLAHSYPVFWEGPAAAVAGAVGVIACDFEAADPGPSLWTLAPVAAFLVGGLAFVLYFLHFLEQAELAREREAQ